MSELARPQLAAELESLAESLDIPPSKYREAVAHYNAVGEWLDAKDSPLREYRPAIHPQGSFRIGTVVRPVIGGCEADYDIDLVCRLQADSSRLTARQLKNMVGDRLKQHGTYRKLLDDEGRRCWTLKYAEADGIGFHLDTLPAVPEGRQVKKLLLEAGAPGLYTEHAIAITERRADGEHVWVEGGSNPAGYALWFDSINATAAAQVADMQKRRLFESNRSVFASIQDVPDSLVRSPLQRAIQLFKRHRDVRFLKHEWEAERPLSIIITTLAARAYSGEGDVATAVQAILESIDDADATELIHRRDGKWWIPNPVNPGENFADRWNDPGSHRAEAFFEWVAWVQQDLANAGELEDISKRRAVLSEAFGVREGHLRASSGSPVVVQRESVPALSSSSHRRAPMWPVRQQNRVKVSASVRKAEYASRSLWRLSGRPVPKDVWLRFEAKTNASPPYDVHWQVVNTGQEAATAGAGQLRGGFDSGEGPNGAIRWERTAFRGTHWVEAFVVKDGVCVAQSGPVYVRVR